MTLSQIMLMTAGIWALGAIGIAVAFSRPKPNLAGKSKGHRFLLLCAALTWPLLAAAYLLATVSDGLRRRCQRPGGAGRGTGAV